MALAEQIARHCPQFKTCLRLGADSCEELLAENERLRVENRDLRLVFEQATVAFREKEAEIKELKGEIEVLRRKLCDQLQQPFTKDTDKESAAADAKQEQAGQADQNRKERKKRGAPKGHRGATRKPPERAPDRIVPVNPCQCPECHSNNVSACQETEEHTQEDLVIIRPLITRYVSTLGGSAWRKNTRILPRLRRVILSKRGRRTSEWLYRTRGRCRGRLSPLCGQNAL